MPSVSKSQQRLMAAAEHGANFPMAKKLRRSMSKSQLHDFAAGSQKGKPEHVGDSGTKKRSLMAKGMNEHQATKASIKGSRSHNAKSVLKSMPGKTTGAQQWGSY